MLGYHHQRQRVKDDHVIARAYRRAAVRPTPACEPPARLGRLASPMTPSRIRPRSLSDAGMLSKIKS